MRDKIEDIKRAIEGEAYLSALALALTLPDICSKIEYGENARYRYSKWFDSHVKDRYFNEPLNEFGFPEFNGAACWALRCSILHSGNIDFNSKDDIDIQEFELCVTKGNPGANAISRGFEDSFLPSGDFRRTKRMRINVNWLCFAIGQATLNFYEESENKEAFEDHAVLLKTDLPSSSLYDHRS
ncbi:hypothetical protein [Eggerthella sinensis]|uniref:hypothetical protein n=1 Tax=Eggerthella sinensis TaxID=242230 RepID=UPI00248EE8F6|nr:hypothetical protein [Eggerthella sinensis]